MKHRAEHRLPWWGHLIILILILGGTTLSVATANPLYALAVIPAAWWIGARVARTTRAVPR